MVKLFAQNEFHLLEDTDSAFKTIFMRNELYVERGNLQQ